MAVALRLLPACYPEGTMHAFIEHGLGYADTIAHLLGKAPKDEREAVFEAVLARTVYDIRPALAEKFGEG